MTNEEIKDKAGNLLISLGLHGDDPDDDGIAAEAFHEFAVELLEKAAQAVCWACRDTTHPARRENEGEWTHYDVTGTNAVACGGSAIHELKYSLAESSLTTASSQTAR